MTEKLDPEEVKEIMSRIFGEITKVIKKYEGFIEKFIGDAVMAVFGVPKSHEDDPVRAIRVAGEIHDLVSTMSPQLEKKVGRSLSMHSGINSGLVVTGEVNVEKGTHGLTGDAINLASRLQGLAQDGEILVGEDTYHQAEGYFNFETLEPINVKGKVEPVQVYRLLSAKKRPEKLHRTYGLRAELIGRREEMTLLKDAVSVLIQGQGSIISICGEAGTGKSRLSGELKATLDLNKIQWHEGHAYGYTQNTPYYPLIDLFTHAFQIEEGDPPEKLREKVETGITNLMGDKRGIIPFVGGLFSLSYPEVKNVSPEFWKSRLYEAVESTLSALSQRGPTVVCFEDLHWADPSFVELLRSLLNKFCDSILFICVYRPTFELFESKVQENLITSHKEIRLYALSPLGAEDMLKSLLKTEGVPNELMDFVQLKAEGNPFYLEEVVNSLRESEIMTRDDGGWKLERKITEADIPSSINGLLTARIDRLENETKRVLQEASVIGRVFLYEILKKITDIKVPLDQYLDGLEKIDLIRSRSLEPDLEYIFKHALTQEVVYSGLLKKERQAIHERIGLAIEKLFPERLPEFYEMLAFHFLRGHSEIKAVDYLIKSGEKGLRRYAVEESHIYYKEGYDLLVNKPDKSEDEKKLLIDLLIKWAYVFYYRGDFKGLVELLRQNELIAESLNDKTSR
ncbi:AAA family ATPase, partial [Thermodesulfobacteriota bacterium]